MCRLSLLLILFHPFSFLFIISFFFGQQKTNQVKDGDRLMYCRCNIGFDGNNRIEVVYRSSFVCVELWQYGFFWWSWCCSGITSGNVINGDLGSGPELSRSPGNHLLGLKFH